MLRSTALLSVTVVALMVFAGTARAQTPAPADSTEAEARALFVAGRSAFEAGRFDDALGDFERSYALSERATLLYNIAACHDRLRHDEEALAGYRRYLRDIGETDNRAVVEGRITALQAALDQRRVEAADADAARIEQERVEEERRQASAARVAPDAEPTDRGGVTSRWWFWTALGTAVAGGVVAAVLIAKSDGGVEGPIAGDYGVVVMTLGQR